MQNRWNRGILNKSFCDPFQSGVDEQLMSPTGHSSIEDIQTYKKVREKQKQALSDVLTSATNGEEPQLKKRCLQESTETVLHDLTYLLNLFLSIQVVHLLHHMPILFILLDVHL